MNYVGQEGSADAGRRLAFRKCNILIVAGPKTALLPGEVKAIDRYLADGGNALFMLDPFIQTGLEPIVEEFGVVLDDTMVIDSASHFWTDVSAPAVTDYNRHEITRDLPLTLLSRRALVVAYGAARARRFGQADHQLVQRQLRWRPIARRLSSIRRRTSPGRLRSWWWPTGSRSSLRLPKRCCASCAARSRCRSRRQGADKAPKFTGKSRVAIIGDSDFATNSFFHIMGNGKLFLNTVNYLASQENLIGIEPRTYDLPRVNLTNRQMKGTFFLSIVLIPALMALVGIAVWWRQR